MGLWFKSVGRDGHSWVVGWCGVLEVKCSPRLFCGFIGCYAQCFYGGYLDNYFLILQSECHSLNIIY